MLFKEELRERTAAVEKKISAFLPEETGYQKTVLCAMNYSVQAGGKRLRPLLMQLAFELYGGKGECVAPFMAAQEMIHTYSLVHDDLPALDNDEYRRGKKTTHAVFGEPMAILAGDGLLNLAFETAAKAFDLPEADPRRVGRALQILARKAGIYGMLGGQSFDVEKDGQPLQAEELQFIHAYKTGALIESALMIGAVLAGASDEEAARMEQIGAKIGFAFQVQDDILDIVGDAALLGKPIGSDEKNHKTTYVTLYGMQQAEKTVETMTDEAVALLDEVPAEHRFLKELLLSLVGRSF